MDELMDVYMDGCLNRGPLNCACCIALKTKILYKAIPKTDLIVDLY